MTGGRAAGSVEDVFREEHGRLLAALVRQFGDLDLAEEVAADAIEAALQRWPVDGVPGKPAAWLLTTARRRAIDVLRRNRSYATRPVPELAPEDVSGVPKLVRDRITREDVVWASDLLSRLSERQWQDAFRAGGYPPQVANQFIRKFREKIRQGQDLSRRASAQ